MVNAFTVKGDAAEIRWSYHKAASLGAWTMSSGDGEYRVTGKVLAVDAFKVSQRPLTFVVPRPKGVMWRFPITSLQIADGEVSASLGPQE